MGSLKGLNQIVESEHLDIENGENINAKRVAAYVWTGSAWQRMAQPGGLIPKVNYDYIDGQQTSATVRTYLYYLGGSGGTLVQTIVVTYTDSTRSDIDNVAYS